MAQVLWNTDIDVYDEKVIPVSVARTISWYLEIPDLLSFSLVSKNAYKAVRDPALWVSKLHRMGVWDDGLDVPKEGISACDFESLSNPLLCLSHIYKVPKLARFQMLKIRTSLKNYYNDLQLNVAYNHLKIFTNYHTPQDQARILSNLLKFNSIDSNEASRMFVRQKITDLMEIFENALLRELEIHYDIQDYEKTKNFVRILIDLGNDQTLIDFFLQKTCFDNETIKFLNPEFFSVQKFYIEPILAQSESENSNGEYEKDGIVTIDESYVGEFIDELASVFNELAHIIDLIFPQSVPMMYKISEEIITNQLQEVLLVLTSSAKEKGLYLSLIPMIYRNLSKSFIEKLEPCENVGETYKNLIRQLIDVSYDSYVSEYTNEEKLSFKDFCSERTKQWKKSVDEREAETTQSILKHVKVQSKNDFLSNFKKVFAINGNADPSNNGANIDEVINYSKGQADAKILAENIKSMNKVFSPELAFDILNGAKHSLERLYQFQEFSINSVLLEVHATIQEEFMDALECLGTDHLKTGFERALSYLKDYNPKDINVADSGNNGSAIGPLVIFFESIHTADMIVQMLEIFYKEEMVHKSIVKNENSVLNPSLQSKRKLEGMVDKFVADGLNIGIEVLFKEIESVYISTLKDSDYNPSNGTARDGPTTAARKVVSILEDNIDLLVGTADKSIVEVFQQEVAERFFQAIVKSLKRSTISVEGAVVLIFDLNLYYDFITHHILTNKKMVYPLFQALKKVGTIYLIGGEDARAIGQIVSDLSKFNGIFSQEEIYEFVQRRQDWPFIKKHVEKVMYGLSLVDCIIM
ncbi:hypothetical protein JCM33374_g593 [Metschnikowia sp. JCM 33374]|nr:hypothetical protein JCM33374_g593 [Metschnikowia sp. JCM 33374]